MDILQAIKSRRSIGKVKPDPVDRTLIEQVLEAGTWAPNHHQSEPWKFIVLTGEGRDLLAKAYLEIAKEQLEDPEAEEHQFFLKKHENKAYRAPVIIAVAVRPSDDPKVIEIEEFGAVYAAIQNMLLAAHALGLGAIWRTGLPAYHPKMKEYLGLHERETILGLIYMGCPAVDPPVKPREPYEKKTIWIESKERI